MKPVYSFQQGDSPFLLSVPHAGTSIPQGISDRLRINARQLPDTDWFVDRLYDFAPSLGASLLIANYSRYVIDLNRPPDDAALYTSAGSSLVPVNSFDGKELYQTSRQPDASEMQMRKEQFWQPYHDKLRAELQRLRQRHGFAILLDAHSIRREVPLLFDGSLPDLNLGSHRGVSADSGLVAMSMDVLGSNPSFSSVLDGRFQGGYITRHYGQPLRGVHALQLEMAQSVYMREQPPVFDKIRVAKVMPVLKNLIQTLLKWSPTNEHSKNIL